MKTCTKCGVEKALSEFHKGAQNRDGLQGHCKKCATAAVKDWAAANPEKARATWARWGKANPERVADRQLRAKYGITLADKIAMAQRQAGACACCAQPFKTSRDTHVDHCHKSGRVRQLLCNRCNTRLGILEDTAWVGLGTAYLARHAK